MTEAQEVDRWKPFIMTDELAARMAAGEMAALAEFVEDNRIFLTGWAWKVLRDYTNVIPKGEYESDDCINQIFVDFPYYDFSEKLLLLRSIFRSYIGIAYGGFLRNVYGRARYDTESLDAPLGVSSRSGDKEDGATLGEILPSREPTPSEVVEMQEHVEEIAPRFYQEIMRVFGDEESAQDVLETVFHGFTLGEIVRYAKKAN